MTVKLCECGCGKPAPLARSSDKTRGYVRGQPVRFIAGHGGNRQPETTLEARFWAKVEKGEGCWMWTGRTSERGYGLIDVYEGGDWRPRPANRISWRLHNGPIPEGMFVCHHCDTPGCVRPDHLFLGTHEDNMRDMVAKNRTNRTERQRGSAHHSARLTEDIVRQMRQIRRECGLTDKHIGEMFGVNKGVAWRAITERTWRHV